MGRSQYLPYATCKSSQSYSISPESKKCLMTSFKSFDSITKPSIFENKYLLHLHTLARFFDIVHKIFRYCTGSLLTSLHWKS